MQMPLMTGSIAELKFTQSLECLQSMGIKFIFEEKYEYKTKGYQEKMVNFQDAFVIFTKCSFLV